MEEQLRIVAVGNNCGTLESLNNILEKAGYQVSITGDGPVALAILEEFNPNLVILNGSGLDCDSFKALLLIRHAGTCLLLC